MTAATAGIEDVRRLNEQFEGAHPADAIRWAVENVTPGRLIVASSFGPTGMVNLHSLAEIAPEVPVAFVDTLYHFPETLENTHLFAVEIYHLNGKVIQEPRPCGEAQWHTNCHEHQQCFR